MMCFKDELWLYRIALLDIKSHCGFGRIEVKLDPHSFLPLQILERESSWQ